MNPYLPDYEYIPDAEPKMFDGRVYLYGSHDRFNGISFCINDYVTYSSSDLRNWKYEGVIYRKKDDPKGKSGIMNAMFASDCVRGKDGLYYLYYTLGFTGHMAVARSENPYGPFKFLSNVKYKDGTELGDKKEPLQFDPGVLIDDDGEIYLYSGFAPKKLSFFMGKGRKETREGAMVYKLEDDMVTIKENAKYICKTINSSKGTSFEGHEFFEASSIRKYDGTYYFIYSSINGHELCYATSKYPDRAFQYQGVLVSNCDLGIYDKPRNYPGNNHGSLLRIGDEYFIFYHRQTNRNSFSRQTCFERIRFENGKFIQAEMTSSGIDEYLPAKGKYKASICSSLYSDKGVFFYGAIKNRSRVHPYITQKREDNIEEESQYIRNFSRHATVSYKYFFLEGETRIGLEVEGKLDGEIIVLLDSKEVARIKAKNSNGRKVFLSDPIENNGKHELSFKCEGKGHFSILNVVFE